MNLTSIVNRTLSFGTILSQIFIILSVAYFLFFRKKYPGLKRFLSKNGLLLAFIISLIATSGSLFYSEVAGFVPCELCWFQRIFMYPQVILLGIALIKKEKNIIDYSLGLAVIGFFISLYHNYIYYFNFSNNSCSVGGKGVSCTIRYVFEFNYITIPMMALTGFILIIIFLLFSKYFRNSSLEF